MGAELAAVEPYEDDSEPNAELFDGPLLRLEDEVFKCDGDQRPTAMMRLAAGLKSKNPMVQMGSYYEYIRDSLLLPEEHDRFDDFMARSRASVEDIQEAVGNVLAEIAARPTKSSSTSSGGRRQTQGGSRSSSPSSRPSPRVSQLPPRVVAVDGQPVSGEPVGGF